MAYFHTKVKKIVKKAAPISGAAFPCFLSPAAVAGFFMPCLRGGFIGFLSGLFFGGIICYLPILSACIGFLVPSRNRQRIMPLLQGRHRACTGRFLGVASCNHARDFFAVLGGVAGPWRHRLRGSGGRLPKAGHADLGRNWQEGRGRDSGKGGGGRPRPGERGIVEGHFLKIIVAAKVA